MAILFSPIGTADPMSRLGDGPMLHIVRHYKPSEVVLFLSPKMANYEDEDHRYSKAIELLYDAAQQKPPVITRHKSLENEVYRFDAYIEEFEQILTELSERANDEPILANVSSGTAGMLESLVAIGSFGRLNLKMLQVKTPKNDINKGGDRENADEYNFDRLWEQNPDHNNEAPNRIIEVKTPNFSDRLLRENVYELVSKYEYAAAYQLAQKTKSVSDEAQQTILAASNRLNMAGTQPKKVFSNTPVPYASNDLLSEYIAAVEVRLNQGKYADYIRALSPALEAIAVELLETQLPMTDFASRDTARNAWRFDKKKIDRDQNLQKALNSKGIHYDKSQIVMNNALFVLIDAYCDKSDRVEAAKKLRKVEEECRNTFAHQITPSSRSSIENKLANTGVNTLNEVQELLYKAHPSAQPGLYNRISEYILDLL